MDHLLSRSNKGESRPRPVWGNKLRHRFLDGCLFKHNHPSSHQRVLPSLCQVFGNTFPNPSALFARGLFRGESVCTHCPYTTTTISCTICTMSIKSTTSQRVTLFIKPAILKQARAEAIVEDMTLTGLVEKALISYLPVVTAIKKIKL